MALVIYLCRFLKGNSWELLTHPFKIWQETTIRIIYPTQHLRTGEITLAFGTLHIFVFIFYNFGKQKIKLNR